MSTENNGQPVPEPVLQPPQPAHMREGSVTTESDVASLEPADTDEGHALTSAPQAAAAGSRRPGGRVHWDTSAPIRRPRGTTGAGPTVTVRSPPTPGSVRRAKHPGPLNLSSRLADAADGSHAPPHHVGSSAAPHDAVQSEGVPVSGATAAARGAGAIPALSLAGARGLDEQGLDNRAFLELQRELQRHESGAPGEAGGNDVDVSEAYDRHTGLDGAGRRRPFRRSAHRSFETPDFSSGEVTPGTETTSDSGSYDPANDSDLDHIDIMAGETDGLPARDKHKKRSEETDEPKGWARLRKALLKQPDKDDEDDAEAQSNEKSYEQGGPTNTKSLPVTTSSGTKAAGPRTKSSRYEREAARLIRAHRLMTGNPVDDNEADGGRGMGMGGGGHRLGRLPSTRRTHLDSGASTPDAMDTAARLSAKPVASGGVLGNLLRLYEQQQREEREARKLQAGSKPSSTGTSPISTPAIEEDGNLSEMVRAEMEKNNARNAAGLGTGSDVGTASSGMRRRSLVPRPGSQFLWTGDMPAQLADKSKRVVASVAKEAGFDQLEEAVDERPKASRSGAGVMGALVATTGNLIGAVSPHHAQIGPNPKRPGYTLDRYLLPEMNAKTLKKTAEIVADAAPRPRRSIPGTPAHYSPGGAGRTDAHDSNPTNADTPHSGTQSPKKPTTRPSSIINAPRAVAQSMTHSRMGSHMHFPGLSRAWTGHSNVNTPDVMGHNERGDYFTPDMEDKLQRQEWQRKLRKRAKDKRRKEEIFITMHVAAILQRQEFLLKLSRALMMFGAPTHRIETQIQQTARVLDVNCRCIYLPNLMLFAFGDDATHTSETKFIKQSGGLDLTKLTDMHSIYWNVIHDKIGVDEASRQLDELMRRKPLIGRFRMVLIGGFCSAFICVGPQGFGGSFVDALAAFPLGMFLVFSQLAIKTELFSNVFEILFAAINSFAASALASTPYFCFSGVVSGSIVLILPGFIVLSGALELQSKNLIAGSVRLVYAIIYSLFLGFGISIGASFWRLVSSADSNEIIVTSCGNVQADLNSWWGTTPSLAWAFLTVPGYSCALALRNQAKIARKEYPVMVAIAICGWAVNHFASTSDALNRRSDVTSALGAFTVGLLSNIFGRVYDGKSYTVAAVGVLFQLPSGLSNGGSLLNFADTNNSSQASFSSGFQVAQSLVEVALGLTVGLYAATVMAYLLGGRKIRGGGLFSF